MFPKPTTPSPLSPAPPFQPSWLCVVITAHIEVWIKTEEKAKVVAAVWRSELIQFLAALGIFHQDDLKKKINRIMATWRDG